MALAATLSMLIMNPTNYSLPYEEKTIWNNLCALFVKINVNNISKEIG
jgi:hypothetical protein